MQLEHFEEKNNSTHHVFTVYIHHVQIVYMFSKVVPIFTIFDSNTRAFKWLTFFSRTV